ncbi:hypothetical protein ACRAWD_02825 [Caulobacter segnis]
MRGPGDNRAASAPDEDVVGQPLRPRRRGGLDIHHIATGQGRTPTLIIGPDRFQPDDRRAGASSTPPPGSLRTSGYHLGPGSPALAVGSDRSARRHLGAAAAGSSPKLCRVPGQTDRARPPSTVLT